MEKRDGGSVGVSPPFSGEQLGNLGQQTKLNLRLLLVGGTLTLNFEITTPLKLLVHGVLKPIEFLYKFHNVSVYFRIRLKHVVNNGLYKEEIQLESSSVFSYYI